MNAIDKALETQLKNIQTKTGRTLDQLRDIVRKSGLTKHGEIRDMLKRDLGLGHGDANTLTHVALKPGQSSTPSSGETPTAAAEVLDGIYTGAKAALRPIHDRLMQAINGFGSFETSPKKGYVSLRRKKQFAMIGPGTNTRVDVGLNMKGIPGTTRLDALPPGGMCQYKVKVMTVSEVDAELIGWIKMAYDGAA